MHMCPGIFDELYGFISRHFDTLYLFADNNIPRKRDNCKFRKYFPFVFYFEGESKDVFHRSMNGRFVDLHCRFVDSNGQFVTFI